MRKAKVYLHDQLAGWLIEEEKNRKYLFKYDVNCLQSISLTMPLTNREYEFAGFPPFFDGLLPEGVQLEGMLKLLKIDRDDMFSQLLAVGKDLPGAVTVEPED